MKSGKWGGVVLVVALVVAVCGQSAPADELITPDTIIFNFDTHLGFCDPDFWSFFGYPTTDFGATVDDSEDGHAAFTAGDWTGCDLTYGPAACRFLGAKHGDGRLCCGQPLCGGSGSGIEDANLDLSLGTGLTLRVLLLLIEGGTPGVRLQFELVDSNGLGPGRADTTAVVPRELLDALNKPYVNRAPRLNGDQQWQTITVWFDGLDWSADKSAIAGTNGLDLSDIVGFKTIWRRGASSVGKNRIVFDQITLIDDPPVLWADDDGDGDVDLKDVAKYQRCFDHDPAVDTECARMDANFDEAIDLDDLLNVEECLAGPGVTGGFVPWCY